MASKKFSLLLLFTLLSYPQAQARDSQSFSKVSGDQEPPVNSNQQQEPNFVRSENENGYGLYGHESGQLTPSATESEEPLHRHLPKNYNPEAYVTEPEEYTSDSNPYTENSYNDAPTRYNSQQEDEEMSDPEQYRYNRNYQYYGGSSFNSEPQGLSDTPLNSRENYFHNGGEESRFRPQGMSDTRSLENGKYFYDINTEKYSRNHPYEALNRAAGANINNYNERSYYGAGENSMRESYQNHYGFQDERSMP